jgi:hypothetical protein
MAKKSPPSTPAQRELLAKLGADPLAIDRLTKYAARKEIQKLLILKRRRACMKWAALGTVPAETIDRLTAKQSLQRVPVPHVVGFPLIREYKAAETRRNSL